MSAFSWRLGTLGLCLLSGCGLSLVSGSATEQEACQVQDAQDIQAAPSFAPHAFDTEVSYDAASLLAQFRQEGVTSDVQLSSFTLIASEGLDDLAFVEEAVISLPLASDGGTVELLRYQKPSTGLITNSLTALPEAEINLSDLTQDGPLAIKLHLQGQAPDHAWKLQTKPCLKLQVDFKLSATK